MLTEKDYCDFLSLVKKMREAQKKASNLTQYDFENWKLIDDEADRLEAEVDAWIERRIDGNKRVALEAENTEFDYGHNVKHFSED